VERPVAVLLLPRSLERFILRDQAHDLLRAPGVVAVEPARVPYGAFGRLPGWLADGLAVRQARRLLRRLPGDPRVIVIFHPFQYPLARALLSARPDCELWYSIWDRYDHAYDASPSLRRRIEELHGLASERASFTFAVSEKLVALEEEAGREALNVPSAADSFPTLDPAQAVIAVSLGHLGWRTDWALLRAVAEQMPELTVLLVGAWHEDECKSDADFHACRSLANLVWLGERSDEEASRLVLCADVGIVPFKVEPFNDAGLPNRILKYARLGRRTIAPPLAGAQTWGHAVTTAADADEFVAALRRHAGGRRADDAQLREWALAQTAEAQNLPLWQRLAALGIETGPGRLVARDG
jgi:hypothetical protein